MILSIVQMQLIFIGTKHIEFEKYRFVSKFGLMHLLATNLCEWLFVVIEEAKHEILHIAEHQLGSNMEHAGKEIDHLDEFKRVFAWFKV